MPLLYDLAVLSLSYNSPNMKLGKTFLRKRLASVKIRREPLISDLDTEEEEVVIII